MLSTEASNTVLATSGSTSIRRDSIAVRFLEYSPLVRYPSEEYLEEYSIAKEVS